LIDAEIRSVRLMDNGSVRVVAEYICPGGYGYRPIRYGASVGAGQRQMIDGVPTWVTAGEHFDDEVVCDGSPQAVLKRLRPSGRCSGSGFDKQLPLIANLQLTVLPDSESSPGGLSTLQMDMFRLQAGEDATPAAGVKLGRVRLNDLGELVVGLTYECPTGWQQEPGDEGRITAAVYMPDGDAASYSERFRRDLICDEETHRIRKRVNPVSPDPAVSGTFRIASIGVSLDLYEVATDTHLDVVEGLTLSG
jgi:hypothetical protein